jgi:hypothetical protein
MRLLGGDDDLIDSATQLASFRFRVPRVPTSHYANHLRPMSSGAARNLSSPNEYKRSIRICVI